MRHSSAYRNPKHFSGEHCRRSIDTANICSPGTIYCRIHIVGTSGTKIRDSSALRRPDDTACLRCYQGLMIDLQEHCRLHKLRINQWCYDRQDRLIRIHDRPLRECIEISFKPEIPQILQKILLKDLLLPQIRNIIIIKMKILNIFYDLLQSRKNGISAAIRIFAVKYIKCHTGISVLLPKISVAHSQLIKIHYHCQIAFVKLLHCHHDLSISPCPSLWTLSFFNRCHGLLPCCLYFTFANAKLLHYLYLT